MGQSLCLSSDPILAQRLQLLNQWKFLGGDFMQNKDLSCDILFHLMYHFFFVTGGGITDKNLQRILEGSGATEFHCSARSSRDSGMKFRYKYILYVHDRMKLIFACLNKKTLVNATIE